MDPAGRQERPGLLDHPTPSDAIRCAALPIRLIRNPKYSFTFTATPEPIWRLFAKESRNNKLYIAVAKRQAKTGV